MKKPRMLMDIDGVCANWIGASLPHIREITGVDHQYDDVKKPMIEDALGLTPEQARRFYEIVSSRGWCAAMPLYDGVREGVTRLSRMVDIFPVTKQFPSDFWVRERERWLLDQLGIDPDRVVHTDSKFLVRGDLFLEDRIKNLERWHEEFPDGITILYDQPYNRAGWNGLRAQGWTGTCGVVEMVDWWLRFRRLV
jgi:5'(3')-deoxyribonucleotidase